MGSSVAEKLQKLHKRSMLLCGLLSLQKLHENRACFHEVAEAVQAAFSETDSGMKTLWESEQS